MDIKAKIDEIVNKVKSEPDIAKKFQSDPVKTVEGYSALTCRTM